MNDSLVNFFSVVIIFRQLEYAVQYDSIDSGYGLDELGQEYNNVVVTSSSGGAKDTNFSANIEKRGFSNNGAITMSSKYVPEHNKNIDGARLSDYDIISSAGDSIDSFRVDESEEDFIFWEEKNLTAGVS